MRCAAQWCRLRRTNGRARRYGLGLPGQHSLDSRLQPMPVPPREIQPQITRHAAVRRCDATDRLQQQAVDLPGFRIRQQVGRTSVRFEAQQQPSENERPGAWYQGRAIAETAAKLQGRTTRSERGRALAASTAQSSGRVLAAWKRRRKTWNRPSTTYSPTLGERASPGRFEIEIDCVASL